MYDARHTVGVWPSRGATDSTTFFTHAFDARAVSGCSSTHRSAAADRVAAQVRKSLAVKGPPVTSCRYSLTSLDVTGAPRPSSRTYWKSRLPGTARHSRTIDASRL